MAAKHWIKNAIKRPGALHRATGTPKGQTIPHSKIEKAAHSSNPRVAHEAVLAETLSHLRKSRHHR